MALERRLLQSRSAIRDLFDSVSDARVADVNAADDIWDETDFDDVESEQPFEILGEKTTPAPAPVAKSARQDVLPGLPTGLPLLDATAAHEAPEATYDEVEPEPAELVANAPPIGSEAPSNLPEEFDIDLTDDLIEPEWESGPFDQGPEDALAERQFDESLSDFDPDAQIAPWALPTKEEGRLLRNARQKAAQLASLIDVSSPVELQRATEFAIGIYTRWRHAATVAALLRLAHAGLDFATLRDMVALRSEWERNSQWWVHRYYGEARHAGSMRSALTWRLVHDVCLVRNTYPVEDMIPEEWLDEWFDLRSGAPGWFSFAEYVGVQVDSAVAVLLHDGLCMAPGDHHDLRPLGDHHSDVWRATRRSDR